MDIKLISVKIRVVDCRPYPPCDIKTYTVMAVEDEPISVTIGVGYRVSFEGESKYFDCIEEALAEFDDNPAMQAMIQFADDLDQGKVVAAA